MKAETFLTTSGAAAPVLLLVAISSASPCATAPDRLAVQKDITVEEVISQGDRSMLRVSNRTPFIVMLYIGGVRVGWMRPYRVGLIRGLTSGYHKMYAHSRYGSISWGPKEIWVPGTWNLLN